MKLSGARLQQPVRLARQLVALALLFADRQQPDARRSTPSAAARRPRPSRRTAAGAAGRHSTLAPASSSTAMPLPGRNRRASAGRSTPGIIPKRRVRRHHGRAGVPGAERPPRRARRAPARRRRGSTPAACAAAPRAGDSSMPTTSGASTMRDVERGRVRRAGPVRRSSAGTRSDQRQAEVGRWRAAASGAIDDAAGGVIAAHGVDGDADA